MVVGLRAFGPKPSLYWPGLFCSDGCFTRLNHLNIVPVKCSACRSPQARSAGCRESDRKLFSLPTRMFVLTSEAASGCIRTKPACVRMVSEPGYGLRLRPTARYTPSRPLGAETKSPICSGQTGREHCVQTVRVPASTSMLNGTSTVLLTCCVTFRSWLIAEASVLMPARPCRSQPGNCCATGMNLPAAT